MTCHKPDQHKIILRKVNFGFNGRLPVEWYQGNRAYLVLLNVISIMFPIGEQFFIDSVIHYRNRIQDPRLRQEIAGFAAQEAMHSKHHALCNQTLKGQYHYLRTFEYVPKLLLGIARLLPMRSQLAITCALEHFTAMFAHQLLDSKLFGDNQAHSSYASLWIWHALEEIEHKAVCFDVYQQVAGGVLGYVERCLAMLTVSFCFYIAIMIGFVLVMLSSPKQSALKIMNLKRFLQNSSDLLFYKKGLGRLIIRDYFAYYAPGFHPWQVDDAKLLEEWRCKLGYGVSTDDGSQNSGQ